jgi:hypothetical protein
MRSGSPGMTCAGQVPDCAIRLGLSPNRSSFSSDTLQSKLQNGIWAVSSVFQNAVNYAIGLDPNDS